MEANNSPTYKDLSHTEQAMEANTPVESEGEWRRGWKIALSGAVGFGCGSSFFNVASGLFIKPMQADLGWTLKEVTIMPIVMLLSAICNPFAGLIVDRWGARPVLITGLCLYGFGAIMLAVAPPSPLAIYGIVVFLGVVGPLSSATPPAKAVASWFQAKAGSAFGIVLSGVSFVALATMPLISFAIQHFGWRSGYLTLAGVALLLGLPAVIWSFREREDVQPKLPAAVLSHSGTHWKQALQQVRFWALFISFALASVALGGFLAHLQPILAAKNFGIVEATFLGMVFAFSMLIGRVGGGLLLDRFWDGGVAFTLLILPALAALALSLASSTTPLPLMVIIMLMIGLGQGAEADFIAFFSLKLFGLRSYSTLVGIYSFAVGMGLALGGLMFAYLADATGSYLIAIRLAAGCLVVASSIIFITRIKFRRGPPGIKG
jgi:predicted MFS family arabinose efflux permease